MERNPLRGRRKRYIGGWTPEKVQSVAKLVEQLEGHPGWAAIQEVIDIRLDQAERDLVYRPKPLEHAEYAMAAGFIRGLRAVKTAAEQVLAEAAEIDEENRRAAERQTAAEEA